jgi:hypothetical protein
MPAQFLGAFVELRNATISFVVPACLFVCPSVCMEQLGFNLTAFHENLYLIIFRNCRENSNLFET